MGTRSFLGAFIVIVAAMGTSQGQPPSAKADQPSFGEDAKLVPNTTSTWEGTLIRDTFAKDGAREGAKGPPGETIAFSVQTDAQGAATMVNLQVTANGATLSAGNELQCFTGGLITGNANASEQFEIFPSSDGYQFSFSDDTPGGGLNGEAFFSNVNGSGSLEGLSFDFGSNQPVDLPINVARGNVNFNFRYELEPEQSCTGSVFTGGICSEPCSWFWEAQCVTNCDGNGAIRIENATYDVDETAGSIDINLVRIQGSIGEVTVDFRTDIVTDGAASGLDYTFTSGTATWMDGDSSPQVVTIPILPDMQVEGPEDFLLTISNPTGGAELGSITSATITIDDRPDLTVTDLMIDVQSLAKNGTVFTIPMVTATITNIADGGQDATGVVATATDTGGSFFADFNLPDLGPQQSTQIDFTYDVTSALQAGDGFAAGNEIVITVDPFDSIEERSETNNEATEDAEPDVRPVVELNPSLTLEDHFFLNGPVASNTIQAQVDWNGPILAGNGEAPFGSVTFDLNGDDTVVPGTASGAMTIYNMGSDLMTGFGCDNNSLVVEAEQDGFLSEPVSESTTAFPFPAWVEWAIQNIPGVDSNFASMVMPPVVNYAYSFKYPEPPFVATVPIPSFVPYFGGQELGILPTFAEANVLAASSGLGTVGLAGTTGLAVAAFEIVGTVFGEGQVQFLCGRSLDLLATTFGIDITGSITREQRLLEIFPGVSVLTSIPLIGDYIEGVLDTVLISGKIGGRGKFTATFRPRTGGALQFDSGTGRIGLPTNASLHVRPLENVDITVFGGGEPFVMAKVPEPNFDRAGILLVAQVQFDIYGFGDVFVQAVNCTIPGGCTVSDMANKAVLAPANWRLLPRKHLAQPDYATFAVSPGKTTVSSGDVETTLVSSTFPRTRLSLSTTGDGRRLLVYVHDDPADPAGRGTEIRSLFYDGASWQAPVQIVDDTQPEFAPQVAFDGVGNGIALWERSELSSLDPITEFDLAFAQSLELVSSVWNGTSWSTPVAVTSNTDMDHAANIASGNDGSVLAIWKNHSGGNLLGDAANPVALSYATWSGSSWSAPQSIASGLTALTQTTVAQRDANVASAAFIRSTGSSGFNAAEAELFLTTFDGLSWAAPQRITNDTTSDTAPALAYDSSGSRHLVWVRDGDLVWLRDSVDIADVVTIRPGSGDVGFQSFELVSDANGNLAIVWPFSQGDGLNAGYLIFDQVADQWGQAQALQDDSDIEGPVVAAFAADGSLNLAYIKTAVTLEDVEVTTPGTGTFTAENVPTEGASDLAYLEHPLGIDATVSLIDLTPGNVLPNQDYELAVSVSNSGDFTIDSLSLEIFQNDGQILVQDVMNLAAGETRIVTFNGNLGTASKQVFRAVVDPAGLLTEKDESNNELTFQLGGPIFDAVFADGFE